MSAAGYTTIFNNILRDKTLSLEAKGLYAVIKSFIGLPDFRLSKRALSYTCSDSDYLLNAAWKELKQHGYLQHYFSTAENGAFCHAYNLMQHAGEPQPYVYSPDLDRANGDVICISDSQSDYTNISTAVLRNKTISLASKGLYALVSCLKKIPGFILRPEGIRSFCCEKLKHFSTLWKRFKLHGLLKQHRFPTGEENSWSYEYELCETPDLETPYLTNHCADGSVSTTATISDCLEQLKQRIVRRKKKKQTPKKKPQTSSHKLKKQIEVQVGADALRRKFGNALTETLISAVYNIMYMNNLTVNGTKITQESRKTVAQVISPQTIERFLSSATIDYSRIQNPTAYLQTSLYNYHQKILLSTSHTKTAEASISEPDRYSTPIQPLTDWEQEWRERVTQHRRMLAHETE